LGGVGTSSGNLSKLLTTAKSSLVNAINELFNNKQNKLTAGQNIVLNGSTISSPISYSTTEKVVGTWIDGKSLYQKTVDLGYGPKGTSSSPVTKTVNHGISNIKRIVSMDVNGQSASNFFVNINGTYDDGNWRIWSYASLTAVFLVANSDQSTANWYATLRYTKTTD
jgi:hypothetical protein